MISSEIRKFLSTRLWWILTLSMMAYLAFIAGAMAFSYSVALEGVDGPEGLEAATYTYSVTSPLGYVFPLIVGSMLFTNEFRHNTIVPTLLMRPNRSALVLSKLAVAALFGVLIGIASVVGTVLGGASVLAAVGDGAYLSDAGVWRLLGWTVLVMALWTVLGVAVGGLLSNQVAAIAVIIGFTQFVEPIARVATAAVSSLSGLSAYLPGAAADAVLGTSFFGSMDEVELLPRWGGVLVMAAYIAIFALGARFITLRRDIS